MSGRNLGRLLGSLLVLAALVGGSFVGDLWGLGDAQTMDIIWNMPAPR
ncbi:hypothetical protein ACN26Y_11040 [Micromonospora sp. WMMD558]|nr:hypothetical protein [Micromonospora sp. WMMC415]